MEAPARGPSVPPVYGLAALVLMGALHVFFPLVELAAPGSRYVGIAVMALGLGLGLWASYLFNRAKTGIVPFTPATFLVLGGPYRVTRNPMYLGMAVMLLGAAVFLASLTPFAVVPLFVVLIDRRFIRAEEAMLERAFGSPYLDYKASVRRWL
jgi:protein-S-isoprenylcysteine O-methyltransferase Ste14